MTRLQMPLALKPPRRPSFDNYIPGPNSAAVATLCDGLEPGHWYFLGGPDGSGRTHLLTASFDRLFGRGHQAQFIGLDNARQWPLLESASADWILLDDVDAMAGDPQAERLLFNALNRWRSEHCGLVMSGLGRDQFQLPDLKSRLGHAARLTLGHPEEAALAELIRRQAREHEVVLGRGVVEYLLSRAPRNAGRITELLERLARRALTERRTISVPLAGEVLRDQ